MAYTGFKKLKAGLSGREDVKSPGGLAAYIGRRKYGKKRFQRAAAEGESMRGLKAAARDE